LAGQGGLRKVFLRFLAEGKNGHGWREARRSAAASPAKVFGEHLISCGVGEASQIKHQYLLSVISDERWGVAHHRLAFLGKLLRRTDLVVVGQPPETARGVGPMRIGEKSERRIFEIVGRSE